MRPWRVPSTTRYMFNIHGKTHFLHCDRTLTVPPLSTPQTPLERRPLPEAGGGRRRRRRRRRRQGLLVLLRSLREDLLPPPLPSGERQVRLQGGHEAVPVRVGRSGRKGAIQVPTIRQRMKGGRAHTMPLMLDNLFAGQDLTWSCILLWATNQAKQRAANFYSLEI